MPTETTPWRCSRCGTINEPDARSCRGCGKWPSLFDLQDGVVDEAEPEQIETAFELQEVETQGFEPETFDPETFQPETSDPESFEPERDETDESEPAGNPRWKLLRSIIVPLAVAVYLVLSILSDR